RIRRVGGVVDHEAQLVGADIADGRADTVAVTRACNAALVAYLAGILSARVDRGAADQQGVSGRAAAVVGKWPELRVSAHDVARASADRAASDALDQIAAARYQHATTTRSLAATVGISGQQRVGENKRGADVIKHAAAVASTIGIAVGNVAGD